MDLGKNHREVEGKRTYSGRNGTLDEALLASNHNPFLNRISVLTMVLVSLARVQMAEGINIHLDEVTQIAAGDPFWAVRGKAIQAYASLEQSLFIAFSKLSGMSEDAAGVIFFKIASAHVRNGIIKELIHRRHHDRFTPFVNSYFKELTRIDERRNQIVHWNVANNIGQVDGKVRSIVTLSLIPPNFWMRGGKMTHLTMSDLVEFMAKCDVFSRLLSMFVLSTNGLMPSDLSKPWIDLFQNPLTYPLPPDHPFLKKPGNIP